MIRECGPGQGAGMGLKQSIIACGAMAMAFICAVAAQPVSAQAPAASSAGQRQDDKLLVEAGQIDYNNDNNTVAAVGDVHLYYKGRTLQADRVVYDRNTKRVVATGNARITEADGTVATGDRFELTDDFRDGFIDSLRVKSVTTYEGAPVTTRFTAPRAERSEGTTTVFERGTYTACEPCEKNPEKPPLWQVRAAKITHNQTEKMIYYEDAALEFAGVPVAWIPYFSAPDPTVRRKSGLLTPRYLYSPAVGYGLGVPYFWNIAPNMDLTVTPTVLSRQGLLGVAEWRHRLLNGSYSIRAAGIFQQDPTAFLPAPLGPRDEDFRGSIETTGRFFINEQWQWGWNAAGVTDKWFLQNYHVTAQSLSAVYFRELTSTLFLTGHSDRAFFDVRGFYFKVLSPTDWQEQQPLVHPVLDYNKRFDGPSMIGGEIRLDANLTSLSRDEAYFQQIRTPPRSLFGLFETCTVFERGTCLLRGISGSYSRASTELTWQRRFIDPLGQVWTPFTSLRVDGAWIAADTSGGVQNRFLPNFIDPDEDALWRVMPAAGIDYRYPFASATNGFGTHTIEPIAQLIVRPSEMRIGDFPNEDAQSLIFDDTTIFERNKFAGYDRVEGGVRTNYGVKYSVTTDLGYGDVLFGQSYQIAGRNSFEGGDLANIGLDSGLDKRASDYVGRFHIAPSPFLSFTARSRFDEDTFDTKRIELQTNAVYGPMTANVTYARYEAQPEIGIPKRRQGLFGAASLNVTPRWSVHGSAVFDLSRELDNIPEDSIFTGSPLGLISGASIGARYRDECFVFDVAYASSYNDPTTGIKGRNDTILLRLELITLGQANIGTNLITATGGDGVAEE